MCQCPAERIRDLLRTFALSSLLAIVFLGKGYALDVVLQNDQFFVFHNYSNIQISDNAAATLQAYIDPGPLSYNTVSSDDFAKIKNVAARLLQTKVRLVSKKEEANLLVITRIYQTKDLHIKNSKGEPSHGLVMIGICKFPITTQATDCESLNYYYFEDYQAEEIFQNVFDMWLNTIFLASSK